MSYYFTSQREQYYYLPWMDLYEEVCQKRKGVNNMDQRRHYLSLHRENQHLEALLRKKKDGWGDMTQYA